ncbi:hypothetical protein A2415_02465 [candidate division WWE3 bacterium RIFOXYC1_FULL_39_7]|uniref:Uncharacterized protein n=1 Tax=candidate division WWE3 bacterium RIFOXYC1_FULL_39_7 TaxID=1802643 RepID=A0A1F4WMH7_UNCKA|nr:MAG: hypothetical protein A2415_02465 [candidate division WWE3 bacterium RIFOXYC1_FULL_39_7]
MDQDKFRINIGCGKNRIYGALNVDTVQTGYCDSVVDLLSFPWPWESNSVDEVYIPNFLARLDTNQIVSVIKESHRILKENGLLHIQVPHLRHVKKNYDPLVKTGFTLDSFDFIKGNNYIFPEALFAEETLELNSFGLSEGNNPYIDFELAKPDSTFKYLYKKLSNKISNSSPKYFGNSAYLSAGLQEIVYRGRKIKTDKTVDIAFVLRPSEFGEFLPFPEMSLTAYLRQEGLSAVIIDGNPVFKGDFTIKDSIYGEYFEYVKNEILKVKPRFIGLGTFTSDYDFVLAFTTEIKKYWDAPIIVGNVQATVQPEDFIYEGSTVEYAVMGEGELTLVELLKAPNNLPETLRNIKGICFYDRETKQAVRTQSRGLIRDLSILPMPAYDAIDMSYYTRPRKRVIGYAFYAVVPVYTGRGCPFRCRYCASGSVWGEHSIRNSPIDRVIEEIKYLVSNWNVDAIYLIDDTFTVSRPRVLEFCEKIKPLNIVWAAQTRVNCIDETLIKAMREAGCIQLTFGVESGSQRMLDLMHKGITTEQIKKVFGLCKKHGMRTLANMMFNLPLEESDDVKKSYEVYEEIKPDDFGLGLTVAYPGTEIYDDYFPQKLKKEEYYMLAEGRGYGKGRFRLCSHDLDLEELLVDFRMNLKLQPLFPLFIRILFNREYLEMVFKSKRRWEYVAAIIKNLPVGFMRAGGILVYNFFLIFPTEIKRPLIRYANRMGVRYGN